MYWISSGDPPGAVLNADAAPTAKNCAVSTVNGHHGWTADTDADVVASSSERAGCDGFEPL